MKNFPDFMRNPKNAIESKFKNHGVDGYVFDGADGSQMIFWICEINGTSEKHVHEYDEYMIVVSGQYNIIFKDKKVKIKAGEEYFIPKGIHHAGEFIKGTRTIHAFGGKRAERK